MFAWLLRCHRCGEGLTLRHFEADNRLRGVEFTLQSLKPKGRLRCPPIFKQAFACAIAFGPPKRAFKRTCAPSQWKNFVLTPRRGCLIFMSTEPLTFAGRGPGARGVPTRQPSINRQSVKLCEKV